MRCSRCLPEFETRVGVRVSKFKTHLLLFNCLICFFHSNMMQNKAVVKNVLSGDTVILKGRARANGPPAERLLALSNVQAPRLGNKDKDDEVSTFELPARSSGNVRSRSRRILIVDCIHRVGSTIADSDRLDFNSPLRLLLETS
jgi:hypothetical protein